MKSLKLPKLSNSRIAFQGGTYSLTVTVIVLAILITINVLASALPSNLTKYDISAEKLETP